MNTLLKLSSFLLFFVLLMFLIAIVPFLVLWSLNTLFPVLMIPYNLKTWSASVILVGLLHRNYNIKIDRLRK
jgi:hypothetical protein